MAKTRAKRAADTTEPAATAAEPAKRRQSKRAKKAEPEPEPAPEPELAPAPVAEPEPILPSEPEPVPIPIPAEPTLVEPEPKADIPIDDEQEEDRIDESTEEPRASDLYLDTVSKAFSPYAFLLFCLSDYFPNS